MFRLSFKKIGASDSVAMPHAVTIIFLFTICAYMRTYTYMKNDNIKDSPEHKAMADAAIGVLDTKFLKALTDPTRTQIVKKLILLGACDVSTISKGLSQDRSVVSRHLSTLEQAGITASRKKGRQVFYDLDGPYIVEKVSLILEALQPMAELCRPFQDKSPHDISEDGDAA